MKIILTIILATILTDLVGQCNIQTINRFDGTTIKSMPAEPIGKNKEFEIGLSVQTNGETYFLAVVQRFYKNAVTLKEAAYIFLNDNNSIELEFQSSDISNIGDSEVSLSLFILKQTDLAKLKNSGLKSIILIPEIGYKTAIKPTINTETLIKQVNCLTK